MNASLFLWQISKKLNLQLSYHQALTAGRIYLFILRSSIGCRAANRSNSFLIISVWRGWEQRRSTIISLSAAETTKKVLNFWWVHHLKSREIRSRQVTQVVFCRSVSSGLFFDQRCCLKEETRFVFGTGNILQPLGNSLEMNCIRVAQFTSCYSTTETLWGVAF